MPGSSCRLRQKILCARRNEAAANLDLQPALPAESCIENDTRRRTCLDPVARKSDDLCSNQAILRAATIIPSFTMFHKSLAASHNVVMVVVQVSTQQTGIPLQTPSWALEHVLQPGDTLMLLGVLDRVTVARKSHMHFSEFPLLGNMLKQDFGMGGRKMQDEAAIKREEIEIKISQFHSKCIEKEVELFFDVKQEEASTIVIELATALGATCVVIDRDINLNEKNFPHQLPCEIIQMRCGNPSNTLQQNQFNSSLRGFTKGKLERNKSIYSETGETTDSPLSSSSSDMSFSGFQVLNSPLNISLGTHLASYHDIAGSYASSSFKATSKNSGCVSYEDTLYSDIHASNPSDYSHIQTKSLSSPKLKQNLHISSAGRSVTLENLMAKGSMDAEEEVKAMEIYKDAHSEKKLQQNLLEFSNAREMHFPDSVPVFFIDREMPLPEKICVQSTGLGPLLCSICKQISPHFCKRPISFTYEEIQAATNNFSMDNFLGVGRRGSVYKGVLEVGQVVAVKKFKQLSTQGHEEFQLEVELLRYAQHRNLVMLIGYCDENSHHLLIYEYVCNRSLNWHLSKENNPSGLEWWARQKIAVGVARGLRYLHEECRVGCIIHHDIRANNILLTHDFEPMVGKFGLPRLQQRQDESTKTEIVGSPGYLAPEYANEGSISFKSDVYAFGVLLLELLTGRKAIDGSLELTQQNLVEWAWPLVLERKYHELLDPRLENLRDSFEIVNMIHAASFCIMEDPSSRPRMNQVLQVLEGDLMQV